MYRLYVQTINVFHMFFYFHFKQLPVISPGGRLAVGPVAHRGAGRSLGGSNGRVSRCIVTYRLLVNNRNIQIIIKLYRLLSIYLLYSNLQVFTNIYIYSKKTYRLIAYYMIYKRYRYLYLYMISIYKATSIYMVYLLDIY